MIYVLLAWYSGVGLLANLVEKIAILFRVIIKLTVRMDGRQRNMLELGQCSFQVLLSNFVSSCLRLFYLSALSLLVGNTI